MDIQKINSFSSTPSFGSYDKEGKPGKPNGWYSQKPAQKPAQKTASKPKNANAHKSHSSNGMSSRGPLYAIGGLVAAGALGAAGCTDIDIMDGDDIITIDNDTKVLVSSCGCNETKYDTIYFPVHDTVVVDKIVPETVYVDRTDTVYVPVIDEKHDTVYVPQTDTIYVPVINEKHDTVYVPQIDTVYVPKVDTVYVPKVDTVYVDRIIHDTIVINNTDTVKIIEYKPKYVKEYPYELGDSLLRQGMNIGIPVDGPDPNKEKNVIFIGSVAHNRYDNIFYKTELDSAGTNGETLSLITKGENLYDEENPETMWYKTTVSKIPGKGIKLTRFVYKGKDKPSSNSYLWNYAGHEIRSNGWDNKKNKVEVYDNNNNLVRKFDYVRDYDSDPEEEFAKFLLGSYTYDENGNINYEPNGEPAYAFYKFDQAKMYSGKARLVKLDKDGYPEEWVVDENKTTADANVGNVYKTLGEKTIDYNPANTIMAIANKDGKWGWVVPKKRKSEPEHINWKPYNANTVVKAYKVPKNAGKSNSTKILNA